VSDCIAIKGVRAFGHHGVFEFEKEEGQDFVVDLKITLDLSIPSKSDKLEDSIDYSLFTSLVRQAIEDQRFDLIERLAGYIAEKILADFQKVISVEVTVHKPGAPVKEKFDDIAVTIVRP
jgi:dihydroneopterin aldolase